MKHNGDDMIIKRTRFRVGYLGRLAVMTIAVLLCMESSLIAAESVVPDGRRLRDIVDDKYKGTFHLGATTTWRRIEHNKEEEVILNREFSYITPGMPFKQSVIHSEPGKWRWNDADKWIESARKNGQIIRMHGPVSPQCGKWIKEDSRTPEELKQIMTEFMTESCKRYGDASVVKWMDVVNEVFDKDGQWFGPKKGTNRWENPWTKIGFEKAIPDQFKILKKRGVPHYIIDSFTIANEHAPQVKQIINQHQMINPKCIASIKELVLYLRSRGLRVDGIGWQAHLKGNWKKEWAQPGSEKLKLLDEFITWAHANDLEFHITECNIQIPKKEKYDADAVADALGNVLRVAVAKRHTGVITWNLWTLSNEDHWNNPRLRLLGLWDETMKPTKAYYTIQKILEEAAE